MKTILTLIAVLTLTAGLLAQTAANKGKSGTTKAYYMHEAPLKQSATTRFSCGDSITDTQYGNKYPTVLIGNQCWMGSNLKTTKYSNGTPIEYPGINNIEWESNTNGAYAWFVNDIEFKEPYGALYNWYAVVNQNGLCPQGWHVPDDDEWMELKNYVHGINPIAVGNQLKSCRQIGSPIGGDCDTDVHPRWEENEWNWGTDDYGFAGLPAGFRNWDGQWSWDIGSVGFWWSSTEDEDEELASIFSLFYDSEDPDMWAELKNMGYSVRCIKTETSYTGVPILNTLDINNVTSVTASCGGEIVDDGGSTVTARGIVWSQSENPTVDLHEGITADGTGTGSYDSQLTDLTPETLYFVRAYAINSNGTAYGQQRSFATLTTEWDEPVVTHYNTPEAAIVHRTGDIDNLGFGWPFGFDPFSGESTSWHPYPFYPEPDDPDGTDRIMVISGFVYGSSYFIDGYTFTTERPDNLPVAIEMNFDLMGTTVDDVVIQMFVDDFQAGIFGSNYFQVSINGVRIPILEEVINALNQTGPIGKLITVQIPEAYNYLFTSGNVSLFIDDPINNVGDGFAIDFVRLLMNPGNFQNTGTIYGYITDSYDDAIEGATVSASGIVTAITDENGYYELMNVPAGLVYLSVTKEGYSPESVMVDLIEGTAIGQDFVLTTLSIDLCEALDNCDLTYITGGSGGEMPWYGQFSITQDGEDAAQSGVIVDDEQTWFETWVTGPGVLSFWWKVSSEEDFDFLRFYTNDLEQSAISGEVDWTYMEFLIPDATLLLRWEYSKDGSGLSNQDAGWVDQVQFAIITETLCEAVDNCELNFSTGGDRSWFSQPITTFDGQDAAQTGNIEDNGQTWLETIVEGPGTLTFYWKVSSEYDCDFLKFYIDGNLVDQMSGEVDWHYKEFGIQEGFYALTWWYTKDGSVSNFEDAGWVDQVVYTPIQIPDPEIHLSGDIIPPDPGGCFAATDLITVSDFIVMDGGSVTLVVGPEGRILLLEGTEVQNGGYFHAWVDPEGNYCEQSEALTAAINSFAIWENKTLETIENEQFFKVFPNPTTGLFTIEINSRFEDSNISIEVFSILGESIMRVHLPSMNEYLFDLSDHRSGIYLIRVMQGNEMGIEKVIKQ